MKELLKRHPEIVLGPTATLRDAMNAMTRSHNGIVFICAGQHRLLGVAADIDIRRALLRGTLLDAPIGRVMNKKPVTLPASATRAEIAAAFRSHSKSHLPLVDESGRLRDVATREDFATIPPRFANRVVVMAGGLGKRLLPLTQNTPKPMLRLADKPILEHLIEQLAAAGFSRFTFTVNYLAGQIQRHFEDGARWGVDIEYVHERKPLGTAGALGLLKAPPDEPLIVLNGDILTKIDFSALLDFHRAEKGLATICVKQHEVQVPYGVVEQSRRRLKGFVEKPTHRFLVNAGIYILDPRVLAWIPKKRALDMPEFLAMIDRKRHGSVACFPMREYWLDIGGPNEWRRAENDFKDVFGPGEQ